MKKDKLYIGPSSANIKTITIDKSYINTNFIVNNKNWASKSSKYEDTFKVIIKNGVCTIQRIDQNNGWDMKLSIYLNRTDNIPVYFINLDKDTDRLKYIQDTLYSIFNTEDIHRISGVEARLGQNGCRLAHIKAHKTAISQGHPYYLICEDDIKPIINKKNIVHFINNSIITKPDLVLFEQGENIENKIQITKNENHTNLYQIFGGGQGSSCYLCSKNFGQKLIDHWTARPRRHIDHSWQRLWTTHNVFFHRPQLFIHREGYSHQADVDWRDDSKPFDWTLWERINISSHNAI